MVLRLMLSLILSGGVTLAAGGDGGQTSGPRHGSVAGTATWVLPHLFNLNPANTSSIQVTNHSKTDTVRLRIDLRDQAGNDLDALSGQVVPRGTRTFPLGDLPAGFVGSAVIFCGSPCLVQGTWEFDLGGSSKFRVGIPAVSATFTDTQWATATFDPNADFAIAVFNNTFTDNACTLRYFNEFGDPVATESFTLVRTAQRAGFAPVPSGFVGRTEVDCAGNAWVTTVVQSPVNGFPTYLRAVPTTVP